MSWRDGLVSCSYTPSYAAVLGQEGFACYESTDCRGGVVETELPLRGECCGGSGLSFSSLSPGDGCRNCFSECLLHFIIGKQNSLQVYNVKDYINQASPFFMYQKTLQYW